MTQEEQNDQANNELLQLGLNPEEFEDYERNQMEWISREVVNLETASVILATKAKKSLGDLKTTAPTFFRTGENGFKSRAASAINKLAHTGCKAMCQLTLNGNAAAAGQLARLAVMLTEALADTVEKGRTESDFKEARKAIQEVAHWMPYWPVLFYSSAKGEVGEILDQFEDLELGDSCPIHLVKRKGRGRSPSLYTPLNKQIWTAMADMYKFRDRAKDFERQKALTEHLTGRLPDHPLVKSFQEVTCIPQALLSFILERPPTEKETSILIRMLELDDIDKDNVKLWAEEVVYPWLVQTLSPAEIEEHFQPIGKVYSEGEATSKGKKSVQDKLRSMLRKY